MPDHDMSPAGYAKRKQERDDYDLIKLAQLLKSMNDTGKTLQVKDGMLVTQGCYDTGYGGCCSEYAFISDLLELVGLDRED